MPPRKQGGAAAAGGAGGAGAASAAVTAALSVVEAARKLADSLGEVPAAMPKIQVNVSRLACSLCF